MTTLKDVASLAGVSIATVSLYINDKAKGRVSIKTQQKIEQAILESGYQRTVTKNSDMLSEDYPVKTIAIFWSIDFKRSILGALMDGIQNAILSAKTSSNYNYVICPYHSDQLYQHKRTLCGRQYHGILIANASSIDIEYLQSITPVIPTLLINRLLPAYHSVFIDSKKVGEQAAQLILEKGYPSVCTIRNRSHYLAMNSRFSAFIQACRDKGIYMPNNYQLIADDSISGGIAAAKEYLSYRDDRPPLIFTASDSLSYGVSKWFNTQKIIIPDECAIFGFGAERTELTKYANPPLSAMDISTYSLGYNSTQLLINIIEKEITAVQQEEISCSITLRDSF